MNWGTKLILGLASFMIFIVAMVVIMFSSKKDALVDNDYYERGINYDQEYDRKEQTKTDHAMPDIVLSQDIVVLAFKAQASGTAKFMRTADKNMDQTIPFETNDNHQVVVPVASLQKGSWRIIIDWESLGKKYMFEKEIIIK